MGYFDDLQKAKDAEYIQVQDYIKQLALETNSSIEATINYLINSEINKIYFKDDNSNYMEPYHNFDYDHPLRSCLADLKLDFMQKLVKAQRYSNEVDEIKIFNEIPRINNYFKKTELPTLQPKFNKFSKAPKPPNHIVGGLANLGSLVTIQERETSKIPNNYQSILMRYDYFTPHQACCLIAGLHPKFNGCDDELEMAQDLINSGIKSKKLALDDDGQIKAEDLKKYLSEKSWLLLGFNDYVTSKNSTSLGTFLKKIDNEKLKTELEKAKERISELEQQVGQAQSSLSKANNIDLNIKNEQVINNLRNDLEKLTTENNSLKEKLSEQAHITADDKELSPKSEAKVADLVYTLLTELKYDLTVGGKGNTNLLIENASKNLNTPLSNNFIAYWLKKAYQIQIKDLKK